MSEYRCRCGQPSPDGFVCHDCTNQLEQALANLGSLIPDLGVAVSRQDHTTSGGQVVQGLQVTAEVAVEQRAIPTQLRTASGPISLVATPDPISYNAADLLAEVRNELVLITRHLCEARGLDYRDVIGGRAA